MTRAVVALLAVGLFAAAAPAQGHVPANGGEILRGLLKYNGFKPVEDVRQAGKTLVVIVGSAELDDNVVRAVQRQVLTDGGALLVITNEPLDLQHLLPAKRGLVQTAGLTRGAVRCPNPRHCFNGDAAQPLLQLQGGDPTGIGKAVAFGKVVTLATRNPHAVILRQPEADSVLDVEVAKFPAGAHFQGDAADAAADAALARMSDPDDRRRTVLVYGDRAMFTNELMVAKDLNGGRTDNFAYAYLLTKFLAERVGDGRGGDCLFIEDGRPRTDFDAVSFTAAKLPGGGIPPIPPALLADMVLDKANEFLAKVEDRDIPNLFQDPTNDPRNRFREVYLGTIVIVGSIVLARYLLARGWGQRLVPDVAPRIRIDPDRGGGLIPERRLGLLQSGNLYEPLRDHLRFVFAQWGLTAFDHPDLPPIALDRKTRPRQRIMTDLFRLWKIAAGPNRTTVDPDDLEDLEEMIADLASAHQKGIWRFAAAGGKA